MKVFFIVIIIGNNGLISTSFLYLIKYSLESVLVSMNVRFIKYLICSYVYYFLFNTSDDRVHRWGWLFAGRTVHKAKSHRPTLFVVLIPDIWSDSYCKYKYYCTNGDVYVFFHNYLVIFKSYFCCKFSQNDACHSNTFTNFKAVFIVILLCPLII